MNRIYFIGVLLLVLSGFCACETPAAKEQVVKVDPLIQNYTTHQRPIEEKELPIDTLNFIDNNGLKQGAWKQYLNGKLWKENRYRNNKLHGKCREYHADGTIQETDYVDGIRDGYFLSYHPDSLVGDFVSFYEKDECVWFGFPWELHTYILRVKGFTTRRDTVMVKVPYNSGKLLYEGMIVRGEDKKEKYVGIHTVWYESGKMLAQVDYNKDTITVFDPRGKMIEKTKTGEWFGRKVSKKFSSFVPETEVRLSFL